MLESSQLLPEVVLGIPLIWNSAGIFYFRTSKLPSEMALNSAEFHGILKGRVSRNSAKFRIFPCIESV